MRIIGGRDYYDSALAYGSDPSIVMVRFKNQTVFESEAGFKLPAERIRFTRTRGKFTEEALLQSLRHYSIAFCDKLYHGIVFNPYHLLNSTEAQAFWAADKLRAWAVEKELAVELVKPWYSRRATPLEEFFTVTKTPTVVRDYMIANRIAILLDQNTEDLRKEERMFHINPLNLKTIGFPKALAPATAYQELSMWVGGVLAGMSPNIVTITDDRLLAESHGFDKHSFRGPRI